MTAPRPRSPWLVLVSFVAALTLGGCYSPQAARSAQTAEPASQTADGSPKPAAPAPPTPPENREADGPLPIYDDDVRWGAADAPVTVIAFTDLQCPFCARVQPTLDELTHHYGASQLRFVIKHNPLPFHRGADEAALSTITIHEAAGDVAALEYMRYAYEHQQDLDEDSAVAWAGRFIPTSWEPPRGWSPEAALLRDQNLAQAVGASGTPTFFINGIRLVGAQPPAAFEELIDAELAAVANEAPTPEGPHIARSRQNFREVPPHPRPSPPPPPDPGPWQVPVDRSPTLGPVDALVTIVEFADYECPFCARVQPTLQRLRATYGRDVRIAFKHNPLPFHAHAVPAAILAIEAYRQRGNDGFWAATAALFEGQASLEESDLLGIGQRLGLDRHRLQRALSRETHTDTIREDQDLAEAIRARGTPTFFINGQRLAGAQPYAAFARLVDAEITRAQALVDGGVRRRDVYATLQRDAKTEDPWPAVDLGPIPTDRPARGPTRAPVTIQMFTDLECPFCARVQATLDDLERAHGGQIRVVWRNLPLSFHRNAIPAANAAFEVRAERGDDAFWAFTRRLFARQRELGPELYERLAREVGADPTEVLAAVAEDRYRSSIDEDAKLAASNDITGTPAFVINGYFVSGARPRSAFERVIRRALSDAKRGVRPAPNMPASRAH